MDETAGELIENIQRDDLTALEIANALQVFIDKRWQQKDVAKRIGKNTIFVSTHLSLLKMPDCVRELYDNDITADTETLNNLRLLFELNEERCRAVCAVAMSDGMTRKQSRELLNDAKRIKNGDEPTSNEDGAVTNDSEQDNYSNSDSELGEEKGGNFTQSDVESSDDTTGDNVVHQATERNLLLMMLHLKAIQTRRVISRLMKVMMQPMMPKKKALNLLLQKVKTGKGLTHVS